MAALGDEMGPFPCRHAFDRWTRSGIVAIDPILIRGYALLARDDLPEQGRRFAKQVPVRSE